jgi:hypothetical protein
MAVVNAVVAVAVVVVRWFSADVIVAMVVVIVAVVAGVAGVVPVGAGIDVAVLTVIVSAEVVVRMPEVMVVVAVSIMIAQSSTEGEGRDRVGIAIGSPGVRVSASMGVAAGVDKVTTAVIVGLTGILFAIAAWIDAVVVVVVGAVARIVVWIVVSSAMPVSMPMPGPCRCKVALIKGFTTVVMIVNAGGGTVIPRWTRIAIARVVVRPGRAGRRGQGGRSSWRVRRGRGGRNGLFRGRPAALQPVVVVRIDERTSARRASVQSPVDPRRAG